MILVDSLPELFINVLYLERTFISNNEYERDKAKDLIKRGESFLRYSIDSKILFAPSRFIGYKNNSISQHISGNPHGSYTTGRITKIIGQKPTENSKNEQEYYDFCRQYEISPNSKGNFGKTRKYWDLEKLNTNVYGDIELPEGKKNYVTHLKRERNPRVRQIAINNFLNEHKRLFCEACGFDFSLRYSPIGNDFIECHHIIPLSKMSEGHKTKPEDIVLLCSNCHRMIHKPQKWLTIAELKEILQSNGYR